MSEAVRPSASPSAERVFTLAPAEARRLVRTCSDEPTDAFLAAVVTLATQSLRRDPHLAFWTSYAAARRASREGVDAAVSKAYRVAAGTLVILNRPRAALRIFDRVLAFARRAGDDREVGAVEVKRIHPLTLLGRHAEAAVAADAARSIRERLGDSLGLAEVEIAVGDQFFRRDRYREALRRYTIARSYLAPDKYRRLRAILDCNSANCLEALHRWGAAQRLFERARAAFDADGLKPTVAQVDHNRAYFAFVRGRYADALRLYDQAEATFETLGDQRQLAQIALERSEVFLQMGMTADARRHAASAAERFEHAGLAKERAQALVQGAIAEIVEGGDQPEGALASARAVFAAEGSEIWVAECDMLGAAAAESRGEVASARALAGRAQDAFLRERQVARAGSADLLLARLDVAAGRPGDALSRIARAEERLSGAGGPWLEVELLRARGTALLAAGDDAPAADTLERAVAALEAHRGSVPADEFMVSFLASRSALFAEAVEAQIRAGRERAAFDCAERGHARAMADLLAARGEGFDAEPRREFGDVRIVRLREELNALYSRLHRAVAGLDGAGAGPGDEMLAEIARRESVLADALRRRGTRDDDVASVHASADRIQQALDGDTTLVEFCAARDGLHVFVVTRDALVRRALPVDEGWIASRTQRFRFHLAKFDVDPAAASSDLALRATRANLADLGAALIGPVRDLLRTRRVVVVPHGVMHGIPFHALPDGEGWLADSFDVVHAPSAAVFALCANRGSRATGPATVFAVPDAAAPLIEREARSVADSLGAGTRVLLGDDATSAMLREAARSSRVLHLATHGMFRSDAPTMSCLRLADTWLNLYDVYGLDVRSELVVLSACESGVASVGASGDPLGLLRGFLIAGAPRVLASLWRVGDEAAALFMESFYGALGGPEDFERALRKARADVRRRFPHPVHWAAFCLFGHPGGGVAGSGGVELDVQRRETPVADTRRVPCVSRS